MTATSMILRRCDNYSVSMFLPQVFSNRAYPNSTPGPKLLRYCKKMKEFQFIRSDFEKLTKFSRSRVQDLFLDLHSARRVMSKTKLKESSLRFLNLLKLSIISFISMGILIGYHGAPLINSLIGVFWFVFAVTSGMVIIAALTNESDEANFIELDTSTSDFPHCCDHALEGKKTIRAERRQKVPGSA